MFKENRKEHKWYWFFRIYCFVVIVVWNVYFFTQMENSKPSVYLPFLFPVLIPAIFMLFSIFVFPWKYSLFGEFERTKFPEETPILHNPCSYGKIAFFHGTIPFFSWTVFPSGLGISILGVGKVFIPARNIQKLESGFFLSYVLTHNCPEVYNPIYVSKGVYDALRDITRV